jgi:hypothetical protein
MVKEAADISDKISNLLIYNEIKQQIAQSRFA